MMKNRTEIPAVRRIAYCHESLSLEGALIGDNPVQITILHMSHKTLWWLSFLSPVVENF